MHNVCRKEYVMLTDTSPIQSQAPRAVKRRGAVCDSVQYCRYKAVDT